MGKATAGTSTSRRLQVEITRSIREIDPDVWNQLVLSRDPLLSHEILRAVEESELENASHWYLQFCHNQDVVAVACLTEFEVSLALLLWPRAQRLINVVRALWPRFLKIRVLFCGLPLSISRSALVCVDDSFKCAVVEELARIMQQLGKQRGVGYLCLKEFAEEQLEDMECLTAFGYFKAHSIPKLSLRLEWPDYESYLRCMRHGYRRMIIKNLRKLRISQDSSMSLSNSVSTHNEISMRLTSTSQCPPSLFFRLYQEVMSHSEYRLETLNQEFFERSYQALGDSLRLLAVLDHDQVLGAGMLTIHNDTLTFLLAGLNYKRRDEYDVYMNLLHGIVALGIEQNCTHIELGQTCCWLKQRIGATSTQMYFWFQARNRVINLILRASSGLLFPKTKLKQLRVFRNPGAGGRTQD